MRVALIQVMQESNSFAPGESTQADYAERALMAGADILGVDPGNWMTGAISEIQSWPGAELVPIFRAQAVAGSELSEDTLADFVERVTQGLRQAGPLDGIALLLHGACVTTTGRSSDAVMAQAVRNTVGPDLPIACGLDHHACITQPLVEAVDALVGHRTQPHRPAETGMLTAQLLGRLLREHTRPALTVRRLPMVTHQEQYVTATGPMGEWFDRAREYEQQPGVWSVSLFPMQPWLDVAEAGWSVVVLTDPELAGDAIADELADMAWQRRERFLERASLPVADALARAAETTGLTLVSDLGDSIFGGAPGTSTELLRALLVAELAGPALVPLVDPEAVQQCAGRTIGEQVSLTVGTERVPVSGRIAGRADGVVEMPGFVHERADHGVRVLLDVAARSGGPVRLMLTERRGVAGNHPAPYAGLGVDVSAARIAVMKTAANIAGFAAHDPHHVQADTNGPTQSDVRTLPWQRLRRPIFPFDDLADWRV